MDAFAVALDRELPAGTPVTIIGHGLLAETHARVAGTINYELTAGSSPSCAGRRTISTADPRALRAHRRWLAAQDARVDELASG